MKPDFVLIHAPSDNVSVKTEVSVYCARGYAYLLNQNQSLYELGRSVSEAEKEKNDWIRKYDNLLKGLEFWKNKALTK